MKQLARRIDLHREPALREVDLHAVSTLSQAVANFGLVLAQQVGDELLAGVPRYRLGRVHQAQGRRGDHGLLDWPMRVGEGRVEIAVRVGLVVEGPARQPKHAPRVTRREGNLEAVGSRVREPMNAIRPEIMVLALLAVRDHRRSGRLELRDRVSNGRIVQRLQGWILGVRSDGLNQRRGARDAADWFCRNARHELFQSLPRSPGPPEYGSSPIPAVGISGEGPQPQLDVAPPV